MRTRCVTMLLMCGSMSMVGALPEPPLDPATLRLRLTDKAIEQAVRETLAESGGTRQDAAEPKDKTLRGDRYRAFRRQVEEATNPSCLGPDALKHVMPIPIVRGWDFIASGVPALPFVLGAFVRGKCQ